MGLKVSLIPSGQSGSETWTLYVPAGPLRSAFPALSASGEVAGLARPDFEDLDRRMLEQRSGYYRRLLPTGAIEVFANGERAKEIVREWLLALLARQP